MPKLVTLDCSLTHVLQLPKTVLPQLIAGSTGVMYEVNLVNLHRQDHDWSSPPCIASLKLSTAGLQCLKIECENLTPVQDWGYMWGRHTQRQCPK